MTEPPWEEPSWEEPPWDEPSREEPPREEPPWDEPPREEPPWEEPTREEPPWDEPSWENLGGGSQPNDDVETVYASGRLPGRTYASRSFPVAGALSRDAGQPARFVAKVFDNNEESKLVIEGEEWVIRETPAGRIQIKLMVAREPGRVKCLWIQRVPKPGRAGRVKTLVSLDRDSSAALIELLKNLDNIPVEGGKAVRVDDSLVRDLFANPSALVGLYRRDPEQFRHLITSDVYARDLIAVSHRREQVSIFKRLLTDKDFFNDEAAQYPRAEDVWQKFFESNPWILGVTLTGQLLTGWSKDKLEQVVKGSSIAGFGKRVDALLKTSGRIKSMVFAEFKTHRTALLAEPSYRSGCWAPSKHLAGGVAQVQGTVSLATQDIRGRLAELSEDGSEVPGDFAYLIKPRSFLIIGMLDQFIGERGGQDPERFRSFELYRRNLTEPEVITFDELLAKAEYLVEAADAEASDRPF